MSNDAHQPGNKSPDHPVLALATTLLANIVFGPFYFFQLLRIAELNPQGIVKLSQGRSVCCEANAEIAIEATALILIGLLLASLFGYLSGGVTDRKISNFLTLLLISACFVVIVIGIPVMASTGRIGG